MSLKDAIAHDIDKIFFNTGDFAEMAIFDGREIPLIYPDDSKIKEAEISGTGLTNDTNVIYAKMGDMPRLPLENEAITIKGTTWYVLEAKDVMGICRMYVNRNKVYR